MGNVYGYDLLAALFLTLFVLLMLAHPSNWFSSFESIQSRWHFIDVARLNAIRKTGKSEQMIESNCLFFIYIYWFIHLFAIILFCWIFYIDTVW